MGTAKSNNGVLIRLTGERWLHITLGHPELADYYYEILDTIENPEIIYEGDLGGKIALKSVGAGKHLTVVYKELNDNDGFIITAYLTNKIQKFARKKVLWEQKN